MTNLHISISAEPIFHLGKFSVTNSMLTGLLASAILLGLSYKLSSRLKGERAPKGFQNIVELLFEGFYNLMVSVAGEIKARAFFSLIMTFFLYILVSNWIGLLPGVGTIGIATAAHGEKAFIPLIRPASADLNGTLALALISVVITQVVGFQHLHLGYLKRFFNFTSPMKFFISFLELISEITKIISFAFRLFGNIFAGEVLLTVSLALLPFLAPLPFLGLEIFVGAIQALVFAVLTLVFMNMATLAHDEEHG